MKYILIFLTLCFCLDAQEIMLKPCSVSTVGKIELEDVSIRMLILRHCSDREVVPETTEVFEAVDIGKNKGLDIKTLGDFRITPNGGRLIRNKVALEGLKDFLDQQIKVDAVYGDTIIIFTTGHGGGGGELVEIGQRKDFLKIVAEVAEKNNQETIWWASNCHASARLPLIDTLNEKQQELVSVEPTSTARELSWFGDEGDVFRALFSIMAEKPKEIDLNQDLIIDAGELKKVLNKIKKGRGDLFLAKNLEEPIFGLKQGIARKIKIIDKTEGILTEDYIPRIKGRNMIPVP